MERIENLRNLQRSQTANLPANKKLQIPKIEVDLVKSKTPANKKLQIPKIEVDLVKSTSFKDKIKASLLKGTAKVKKEEVQFGKLALFGSCGVGKSAIVNHFVKNNFTENYTPTSVASTYEASSVIECKKPKKKNYLTVAESFRRVSMLRSSSAKLQTNKEKDEISGVKRTLSFGNAPLNLGQDLQTQQKSGKYFKEFFFELVDTPGDIHDSSPICYRSTISESNGFLLVCSYDKPESISYIRTIFEDIKNIRRNRTVPILIVINKTDLVTDESEILGDKVTEMAKDLMLQFSEVSTLKKEGFKTLIENITREMNLYNEDEQQENNLENDYDADFWG